MSLLAAAATALSLITLEGTARRADGTPEPGALVCALRSVRPGETVPSHEYLVSLKTTAEHYPADRQVLARFLRSWRVTAAGP